MSDKAKELAEWARQFGEGWYTDDDAETEVGKRLDAIAAELTRLAEVERVQRDALEWIATFGSMLPTSVLNRARAALGAKDKGGVMSDDNASPNEKWARQAAKDLHGMPINAALLACADELADLRARLADEQAKRIEIEAELLPTVEALERANAACDLAADNLNAERAKRIEAEADNATLRKHIERRASGNDPLTVELRAKVADLELALLRSRQAATGRDEAKQLVISQLEAQVADLESRLEACEATMKRDHDEAQSALEKWANDYKAQELRLDRYAKLEAACREWKPVQASLHYPNPDPPDDPITWALKELDREPSPNKAVQAGAEDRQVGVVERHDSNG